MKPNLLDDDIVLTAVRDQNTFEELDIILFATKYHWRHAKEFKVNDNDLKQTVHNLLASSLMSSLHTITGYVVSSSCRFNTIKIQ